MVWDHEVAGSIPVTPTNNYRTYYIFCQLFVHQNVFYFNILVDICQDFFQKFFDQIFIGAGSGNRTHLASLEGWSITDIRYPHTVCVYIFFNWSARRDSNPQLPPWQGGTLPLSHSRNLVQMKGVEPPRRRR